MASDGIIERIAAWEAAGVIDPPTADRLRAAEAAAQHADDATAGSADAAPAALGGGAGRDVSVGRPGGAVGSFFGPIPTIAELFGYLGGGFLLAAWHTLNLTSGGGNVLEWLVPAVVLAALGGGLARRSERERRAAGVAFGLATAHIFGTVLDVLGPGSGIQVPAIAAGGAALAALGFRRLHPTVLTQLGLLAALAGVAGTGLQWLHHVAFPIAVSEFEPRPDPNALARVVLNAAWWIAWGLGFGVMGLREAVRADGDAAGARRVAVTRFVAGLTAVAGTASAIMAGQVDEFAEYSRILPVWLGDGALLVIAGALLGLAIRRGATAYLFPAALGIIVAFSDLNAQYVVERTGVALALLLEGLILIGAGLLADRLRRRLAALGAG